MHSQFWAACLARCTFAYVKGTTFPSVLRRLAAAEPDRARALTIP